MSASASESLCSSAALHERTCVLAVNAARFRARSHYRRLTLSVFCYARLLGTALLVSLSSLSLLKVRLTKRLAMVHGHL